MMTEKYSFITLLLILVAVSSVDQLLDYVINSPKDTFTSAGSVNTIIEMIERNKAL